MPIVNLAQYPPSHADRLAWFRDRTGATTRYPEQLADGTFLVSRPKGIYKPKEIEYALSIRINLESPYADGEIYTRDDGSWYFSYHQENPDPDQRDEEYTNRGLLRCIDDRVPVGVLRERVPDKSNRDTYEVLGIAVPTGWVGGYFLFEGVAPNGKWHRADTAGEVFLADAELDAEEPAEPPADDYDARLRVTRQIVARRGQPKFRASLIDAYGGRCAVTGADAEAVLEAAHIRPYRGAASNVVTNGLLLRGDIHTLFDLSLIGIDPESLVVRTSKALQSTTYANLDGHPIELPASGAAHPSGEALSSAWTRFVAAEQLR